MKVFPNIENLQHYQDLKDQTVKSSDKFGEFKRQSFKTFLEKGLPVSGKGNERWKYLDLRSLVKTKYKLLEDLNKTDNKFSPDVIFLQNAISIVNGQVDNKILSSMKGIKVLEVDEIDIGGVADNNEDGMIALNSSFFIEPLCFRITEDFNYANLNIVFSGDSEGQRLDCPRLFIEIDSGVEVTINELHVSPSADVLKVSVLEIILQEGSKVLHNIVVNGSKYSKDFLFTRISQNKNSYFKSVSYSDAPSLGASDIKVCMNGEYSECDLRGLYFTTGSSQFNTHVVVDHNVPYTKSNQFYKGILTDNSRAVFSGKILVKRDAQKTYATQKDLNLLMSKGAEIDTKPSLEIYADDVECFHGATAGHVDENTLYYMMSRGIDKDRATQILVRGFADEIINDISDKSFRKIAVEQIDKILPSLSFQ